MNHSKLLIADADELYRRHVRDYLMEMDCFDIFDVGSAETAMNTAIENQPDVVLIDIMLPDMSGIEVCRKIKLINHLKPTPVIIHTANICQKDRLSAFLAGAHVCLEKPCNLEELYECLQGVLRSYGTQGKSEQFGSFKVINLLDKHTQHSGIHV